VILLFALTAGIVSHNLTQAIRPGNLINAFQIFHILRYSPFAVLLDRLPINLAFLADKPLLVLVLFCSRQAEEALARGGYGLGEIAQVNIF